MDEILKGMQIKKQDVADLNNFYVYTLWLNEELVYIGRTIRLFSRIETHRRTKEFTHYSAYICDSELEMEVLESEMITKYQPVYNVAIGSGYESLQKFRGRIRSISVFHKYSSKYYLSTIKQVLSKNGIEITDCNGANSIRVSDVPRAMSLILKEE